jgi:hypothetical protein
MVAQQVGLPPANFRVIMTSPESEHSLSATAVDRDVARGLVPLYLCMTVGTTRVSVADHVREPGEVDARGHSLCWQCGRLPRVPGIPRQRGAGRLGEHEPAHVVPHQRRLLLPLGGEAT